jgi:hypothetical protein
MAKRETVDDGRPLRGDAADDAVPRAARHGAARHGAARHGAARPGHALRSIAGIARIFATIGCSRGYSHAPGNGRITIMFMDAIRDRPQIRRALVVSDTFELAGRLSPGIAEPGGIRP